MQLDRDRPGDPASAEPQSEAVVGDTPPAGPRVAMAIATCVEVQDQVLSAATELDRLLDLIQHAGDELMSQFEVLRQVVVAGGLVDSRASDDATNAVGRAVVALQFQDMASQLVSHTQQRLHAVAELVGEQLDGDEAAPVAEPPRRSSPVAQRQMDAGSIELF